MDLIAVLTIIGIAVANIGTTITLFLWATNHAANDAKEQRQSVEEHRRAMQEILRSIQEEMKDFHGRLCQIEANRK